MMMAPEYYIFTGRDGEEIPRYVTHVLIVKALNFIPARAFERHPNIEEVICHDGVEKIEEYAFHDCPSLRRVIIPGVKILEKGAFNRCYALSYIECGKLEIIRELVFLWCETLSSIDLPSIRSVKAFAFSRCTNLINAKFGKELESIGAWAFNDCRSMERITVPLKEGMISNDNIFKGCKKLNYVDLVGGVHETIAALLLEEWENCMNEEIDSINQILPKTSAGDLDEVGGKARAIQAWVESLLHKYTYYKAEHRRYLNVAAATLQTALPNDILLKNVLPFVELPTGMFEGED